MKIGRPLISVVIPAFNAGKYLYDALLSVMWQDYKPLELIVVDDGSTDNTRSVVENCGFEAVKYFYQENSGPAAARNKGIKVAKGEIIGFLDADDWWDSEKLNIQEQYLQDADIVMGSLLRVRQTETNKGRVFFEKAREKEILISFGSALIKRTVFEEVGLLDEAMWYGEDMEWFLRAKETGISMKLHDDVVLYYRLHENNMTRQKEKMGFYYVQALKKSLERRRKQ